MNKTAKALARKVANGAGTTAERRGFMEAMGLLGWTGQGGRGSGMPRGVTNHISGQRLNSWKAVAQFVLEESGDLEAHLDRVEEAEVLEMAEDEARAQNVSGDLPLEPAITFSYVTQTAPLQVGVGTSVITIMEHEASASTESACESGAALGCEGEGFLRILPESMLPGQERVQMVQCLPCYEASADAYSRKLHHYTEAQA